MTGTAIYIDVVEWAETGNKSGQLLREMWASTPWIINVYLGDWVDGEHSQQQAIYKWCQDHFGEEAVHEDGQAGRWQTGGAIGGGFQHIGFDTEEAMNEFMAAWSDNVEREKT